jgi:hypothetical protein
MALFLKKEYISTVFNILIISVTKLNNTDHK